MLVLEAWGPKYIPRACVKSGVVAGACWGRVALARQPSLLSEFQARERCCPCPLLSPASHTQRRSAPFKWHPSLSFVHVSTCLFTTTLLCPSISPNKIKKARGHEKNKKQNPKTPTRVCFLPRGVRRKKKGMRHRSSNKVSWTPLPTALLNDSWHLHTHTAATPILLAGASFIWRMSFKPQNSLLPYQTLTFNDKFI